MTILPKGHILHKGRLYVRTSYAAKLMGVAPVTVTRWFKEGKIDGVNIPSSHGSRNTIYVNKNALTESLFEYQCVVCGKKVKSNMLRNKNKNRFCSIKCGNKWWSINRPVTSEGKRKTKP